MLFELPQYYLSHFYFMQLMLRLAFPSSGQADIKNTYKLRQNMKISWGQGDDRHL